MYLWLWSFRINISSFQFKLKKSIMRHLLSIIIVVILVISPSCKSIRENGLFGKKRAALEALKVRQDSIRVADSIRVVQDRLMAIEKAKADSLNKIEADRLALDSKYRYNIIVGSFITPEYAKTHAETYRKMGYDSKIIQFPGSRFELVSAEGHDNFTKAVERLTQFQDTVAMDAWMYIKK
jgi:hypothetical protein